VYGFEDAADGGAVPSRYLGLVWTGMRVANAQQYAACGGNSGFKYGMKTPPNVAYTLEAGATTSRVDGVGEAGGDAELVEALSAQRHVGAGGNVTALRKGRASSASVAAPDKAQKLSVLGLWATAAWQVRWCCTQCSQCTGCTVLARVAALL
jgi:hypothetical protein